MSPITTKRYIVMTAQDIYRSTEIWKSTSMRMSGECKERNANDINKRKRNSVIGEGSSGTVYWQSGGHNWDSIVFLTCRKKVSMLGDFKWCLLLIGLLLGRSPSILNIWLFFCFFFRSIIF